MKFECIIYEKQAGIATIKLNRPQVLNAMNRQLWIDFQEALEDVKIDAEIKVLIITGEGRAFSTGADLKDSKDRTPEQYRDYLVELQETSRKIIRFEKPTIAAINGYALGGGTELALACHIRIASENAKMGQPEVKLGLIPGFGGTQRLARLVGKGKAMELILSGKVIDVQEALRIGLVNQVVSLSDLFPTCEALAREITANGPLAVEYGIEAINKGLDLTLDEGLLLEAELFGKACTTEDSKEGTKAFLEKRKANFKGR